MSNAFIRGLRRLFGIRNKKVLINSVKDSSTLNNIKEAKLLNQIKSLEEERIHLDNLGIKEIIVGEEEVKDISKVKKESRNIKSKKKISKKKTQRKN